MMYLGNYAVGATIDFMWSSNDGTGASITRGTNGTISVYKGNSTTQSTAGVTDTEDFDSLTGIHHVRITTASDGSFYASGNDFMVVLSGATIDGKAVNAVLALFSLQNRYPAVADVQSGLATAAALSLVAGYLDTEVAAILAAVDTEIAAIKAKTDNLPSDPADDSDIDAQLAAIAGYLDTEIAAIKAKTDNLPSDPADDSDIDAQLAAIAGYLDTEIAAIKAKTDNLPAAPAAVGSLMGLADGAITSAKFAGGAITAGVIAADAIGASELAADAVTEIQNGLATAASIAALNNLSAAQVNAEVVDALSVDTYAEPASVPPATASLAAKIGWVFMLVRNKRLTTASADKVRNDADSADVATAALSDDGTTFTRGEYA